MATCGLKQQSLKERSIKTVNDYEEPVSSEIDVKTFNDALETGTEYLTIDFQDMNDDVQRDENPVDLRCQQQAPESENEGNFYFVLERQGNCNTTDPDQVHFKHVGVNPTQTVLESEKEENIYFVLESPGNCDTTDPDQVHFKNVGVNRTQTDLESEKKENIYFVLESPGNCDTTDPDQEHLKNVAVNPAQTVLESEYNRIRFTTREVVSKDPSCNCLNVEHSSRSLEGTGVYSHIRGNGKKYSNADEYSHVVFKGKDNDKDVNNEYMNTTNNQTPLEDNHNDYSNMQIESHY